MKIITENHETTINTNIVKEMLELSGGVDVDVFEGALQDRYIFWNTNNIEFEGFDNREYIIVKDIYVNEWSSKLVAILTDDIDLVEEYYESWKSEEDEYFYNN